MKSEGNISECREEKRNFREERKERRPREKKSERNLKASVEEVILQREIKDEL